MNPEVLVCVTGFVAMSAFLVIDSLQVIHETVTEHHIYGPAKVRFGLIGFGSWTPSILAQSVMEIEMACNGNMAKKLQLGKATRNSHIPAKHMNLICCQHIQNNHRIIWWFPFHRSSDMKWFSICRASLVWVNFFQYDDEVLVLLCMTGNDIW